MNTLRRCGEMACVEENLRNSDITSYIKQTTARCLQTTIIYCVFPCIFRKMIGSRLFICRFIVGSDLLEGQLVNSQVSERATKFASVFMRVLSSQWRKPLTCMIHRAQR